MAKRCVLDCHSLFMLIRSAQPKLVLRGKNGIKLIVFRFKNYRFSMRLYYTKKDVIMYLKIPEELAYGKLDISPEITIPVDKRVIDTNDIEDIKETFILALEEFFRDFGISVCEHGLPSA